MSPVRHCNFLAAWFLMGDRRHYTPEMIADFLVSSTQLVDPESVADFCVGDGSLIRAAAAKWPNAKLFINDVDLEALGAAAGKVPSASRTSIDFLNDNFEASVQSEGFSSFRAILLNPPFSNEKSRRWRPRGTFNGIVCSRAMAFLLTAFDHLHSDGELLAILPASTLHSELDQAGREALSKCCEFEIISQPKHGLFPGIDATTYTARIKKATVEMPRQKLLNIGENFSMKNELFASILRGKISLNKSDRKRINKSEGLIHTTSIKDGKVIEVYEVPIEFRHKERGLITQFAVILPRVGRILPGNIALKQDERRYYLSDCLFAVQFAKEADACRLHSIIINRFQNFQALYRGTGAPYLTRSHLCAFLESNVPASLLSGVSSLVVDCNLKAAAE